MKRLTRLMPLVAVAALALALLAPAPAFAVRKLAISAGSFSFDVAPGQSAEGSITVINDGDEPIQVLVYAADQKVDPKGAVSFVVPSRTDLSSTDQPSAWTQVLMPAKSKALGNIPYIELAPKERVPIRFNIKMPQSVTPGDHNVMLFFEMFSGQDLGRNSGAAVSGRLGSRIQLRVQGDLVERLNVSRFAVPSFVIGNGTGADFTVKNLGNVDQRIVADVQLLDRSDDPLVSLKPINNRLIFAGNNLEATSTLVAPGTLLGQYTVRLQVYPVNEEGKQVGQGKNLLIEKRTVWIVPEWLLIAAGALVLGIFVWIIWALGRRSAMRRQRREAEKAAAASTAESETRSA